MAMFGNIKRKIIAIVGLLIVMISSAINIIIPKNMASASSSSYEQSYVAIEDIYREDNELHVILKDELLVKDMTYEYSHYVDEVFESDLVVVAPKQLTTKEYVIELPIDTVGVKVWKVKHQIEDDYFKNKYTTGKNSVGDINTIQKKNYITVTADKLVAYEYSTQDFEMPWYMWTPLGLQLTVGDYLFREETSASYIWYFNIDKKIDRIIDVNITYATFEYSEILWGTIESKHDYKSHGPMKINADQQVFDYAKFIEYAEDECDLDFAGGTCNNKLKEQGEEYFKRSAIGASDYETYDWYVQVTLDDLLKENNVLWGAYENKEYLQEVTLLNISYYFEGEEYFDVNVLDEDTGELNIIPDESPLDKIVGAINSVYDWIDDCIDWIKDHVWIIWFILGLIIVGLIIKFWRLSFAIINTIWEICKWTIFLPITLIVAIVNTIREEKREEEEFEKKMRRYQIKHDSKKNDTNNS